MKECELCDLPARMYCESDQASLCWNCDSKVHSANFLVARHSRSLLCHVCQSPTPWKASGMKLGPTVSVCEKCVSNSNGRQGRGEEEEEEDSDGGNDDDDDDGVEDDEEDEDIDDEGEDEDDEYDDETDDVDEDEDGDNQVVPWTSTPPPPVSSSSSSEGSSRRYCSGRGDVVETEIVNPLKRTREDSDPDFQEDPGCTSSQLKFGAITRISADDEATSVDFFRPLKDRKRTQSIISAQTETKTASLVGSLERFRRDMISGDGASATILGICKLSKDHKAVDLISIDTHDHRI